MLKRPGPAGLLGTGQRPGGVLGHHVRCVGKILRVIRAEMQRRSGRGQEGQCIEQGRLQDAVFPMPSFRPGVREQNKNAAQPGRGEALLCRRGTRPRDRPGRSWPPCQCREEERRLGLDKKQIGQTSPLRLSRGPPDPVGQKVYAHAEFPGVGGGKRVEIVAVATPDLERERHALGQRQTREKLIAQGGESLISDGGVDVDRHGPRRQKPGRDARKARRPGQRGAAPGALTITSRPRSSPCPRPSCPRPPRAGPAARAAARR